MVSLESGQSQKRKQKKGGCFSFLRCASSGKANSARHKQLKPTASLMMRELTEKKVKLVPLSFRPFKHVRKYVSFIDVIHVRELEIVGKADNLDLLQEKFIEEVGDGNKLGLRDNESKSERSGSELCAWLQTG